MADIFRKTLDDQEVAAGTKDPIFKPKPPPPPSRSASGVNWSKADGPKDPEKEAARAAAKIRLLRKQDGL